MKTLKRECTKEVYDKAKAKGGKLTGSDAIAFYGEDIVMGNGIYNQRFFESNGKYYVRFESNGKYYVRFVIGDTCD